MAARSPQRHRRRPAIRTEIERLAAHSFAGAVVELGCYQGAMALWIRAVLDATGQQHRPVHVYDSFQGLPDRGKHDPDLFEPGLLSAEPQQVLALHDRWGRTPPVIHPGWFADTLPGELPAGIAFAYLDGDYYDSIAVSLAAVVPRMAAGGVIVVDDYADLDANPQAWNGLPGVKTACEDYFGIPCPLEVIKGAGTSRSAGIWLPSRPGEGQHRDQRARRPSADLRARRRRHHHLAPRPTPVHNP